MAVPDLILKQGQVMAQQTTSSSLNIKVQQGKLLFGIVVKVYSTSDATVVGDYVLIDPLTAVQIKSGTDVYYIIEEQAVLFNEGIPV